MPYQERTHEEILAALEQWLAQHLYPDGFILTWREKTFTPRQILEGLRAKDDAVLSYIDIFVQIAKDLDEDPVEVIARDVRSAA